MDSHHFLLLLLSAVFLTSSFSHAAIQIPFQRVFPPVTSEPVDESVVSGVTVFSEDDDQSDDKYLDFSVLQKRATSKQGLSGSYVRYLTNADVIISRTVKKTFKVLIDTGNSLTAFPVSGCRGCSNNVLFTNQTSPVFCNAQSCDGRCSSTTPQLCDASQVLSNGLTLRGYRTLGQVAIGNLSASLYFQAIEFQRDGSTFNELPVEGVLSFGHVDEETNTALPTYFDVVSTKYKLPKVFTLTLTNVTGTLTLGGTDESVVGPYFYTSMLMPSNSTWEVSVTSMKIGSQTVITNQIAQIESSSATIQMEDSVYQTLQESMLKNYPNLPGINGTVSIWNGLCFSNVSSVVSYPPLSIYFDGFYLSLSPFDYFFPVVDKANVTSYCFGISRGGEGIYLGDPFLRAFSTTFDEENHRIGFALASLTSEIYVATEEEDGLSRGQKAAIAIGVIAGVALVVGIAIFVLKPRNSGGQANDNEKMLY
eukprot:TRINITY_DN768_c0_g1_i2.p1 TRINITY_DN768_c0_g1~~TRINITY_DN768_c0_g1_i2.p1  ORF type:complete len:479 (+),score=95.55 TRINITY_DN768_c0_g1_i2:65-1501(+)